MSRGGGGGVGVYFDWCIIVSSTKQPAHGAVLGTESRTPSSSDCKGKLLTSILTEERTTPELSWSSSHFGVAFCWAIVGQDSARQWPGLPHAKHVPDLGRGEKPGMREGIGRAWLGGVDSADAGLSSSSLMR